MPKPVMIGAHVPRRPKRRPSRDSLCESAALIKRNYAVFVSKRERSHLVYQPRCREAAR